MNQSIGNPPNLHFKENKTNKKEEDKELWLKEAPLSKTNISFYTFQAGSCKTAVDVLTTMLKFVPIYSSFMIFLGGSVC